METTILDEPVHLVEQGGNLLDLVDDNLFARLRPPLRLDLLAQEFGIGGIASELVGSQQIEPAAPRLSLFE